MNTGAGRQLEAKDDFFSQGIALAKKGLWQEALAAYKESRRIRPNNAQTCLNMGFVYYELGYDQEAQAAFAQAAQLQARSLS